MGQRSTGGPWIVGAIAGLGCLGLAAVVAMAIVAVRLAAETEPPPPLPVDLSRTVREPPFCPRGSDDEIRVFVELTALRFTLAATDGTSIPMPYEGSDYPLDTLRERLAERHHQEPNRRQLFVISEPGVPSVIAERAAAIAREEGFLGALHCRQRTAMDDLVLGPEPHAPPTSEDDPMSQLGALMGESIGSSDDGAGADPAARSGYGDGAGGLRGRGAAVARVRTGSADVRGSLSREVIRRVIQRHISEVRSCYEQELERAPDLEGRIMVSFIIAPDGSVQSATIGSSTIDSSRVEGCIVQAVRRWTFPAPDGGGVVGVNYPFVLSTAG